MAAARTRLWIAGASTITGQAIERLARAGKQYDVIAESIDLADPAVVERFVAIARPDAVIVSGGDHAGIGGNLRRPADLITDNLLIAAGVIPSAHRHGVKKLLYLGSSCIYPREAPQPYRPETLWTGPVEPTSAAYATAKLAGLRLVSAHRTQHRAPFISAIAADVYGPGDDFSPDDSHVVAALIRRASRSACLRRDVTLDLGHRPTAPRVHLRRRSRRRVSLRAQPLRRRRADQSRRGRDDVDRGAGGDRLRRRRVSREARVRYEQA